MSNCMRVIVTAALLAITSASYAIQVDVRSPSEGVFAVGFTVNGNRYGAPGKSFSQKNMPKSAAYYFGVRIGGLIADYEDIACVTLNGQQPFVVLNNDSKATLMYDGNKKCYVEII